MAAPTETERELIEQFRLRLKDVEKIDDSDAYLLRWIRAREFDLDKAEEMLRNDLKWRKENRVDELLDMQIDDFFSINFPYWIIGSDKIGHPVIELPFGSWDLRKAVEHPDGEKGFLKYTNFFFERMLDCLKKDNQNNKEGQWPLTQVTGIADFSGYSYAQLLNFQAVRTMVSLLAQFEAHYPEILFTCFVINAPSIFPMFFELMKKVLCPNTIAKISIFGSNQEEWETAVHELVAEDQRSTQFGGTCTDRNLDNVLLCKNKKTI